MAPEKAIVDEKLDDVRASLEEMKANLDSVMSSTQEEEDQLIVKREKLLKISINDIYVIITDYATGLITV